MIPAARHLAFHGAVVLLFGLLLGAPYARSIKRQAAAHIVNSWRVAHLSLPIGATLLCWRPRVGVAMSRWARSAVRLSAVAAGWFGVLTIQTVLSATTAIQAWRTVGLVERALSATEMATVVVLALWLLSGSTASPEGALDTGDPDDHSNSPAGPDR